MYCTKCGTELRAGLRFCPKCGTPIEVGATEKKPLAETRPTEPMPASPQPPAPRPASASSTTLQPATAGDTAPQPVIVPGGSQPTSVSRSLLQNKPLLIGAAALAVIAIVLVAVLAPRQEAGSGSSANAGAVLAPAQPVGVVYGSSASNLVHGGHVAQSGDTIFFTQDETFCGMVEVDYYTPRIFSAKLDGSDARLIYDPESPDPNDLTASVASLQVVGDRLYFARYLSSGSDQDFTLSIRSIAFDGSDERELVSTSTEYGIMSEAHFFQIYDDALYFCDKGILYSADLDGPNRSRVCDLTDARGWVIESDTLYYKRYDSGKQKNYLMAYDLSDGDTETILSDSTNSHFYSFVPHNGSIYYNGYRQESASGDTWQYFARYDIQSGQETTLLEIRRDGGDDYLGDFSVDENGVCVAYNHPGARSELYGAPLEKDSLERIYTYDAAAFVGAKKNLSAWESASLTFFTALGERLYFMPCYLNILYESAPGENLDEYVYSLCSVGRDGSGFAILTNKPDDKGGKGTAEATKGDKGEKNKEAEKAIEAEKPAEPEGHYPPAFTEATASSTRSDDVFSNKTYSYSASNVLDFSDNDAAWNEGVDGTGIGEWIRVSAAEPQLVKGFKILPGYAYNKERYLHNHRPRQLKLELSDGYEATVNLNDDPCAWQTVNFDEAHATTYLKLTISDVYRSDGKYDDTCITAIQAF